jgi:calcium-dependent protein kinase
MGLCFAKPSVDENKDRDLPHLSVKNFGFLADFQSRYVLKDEIGRGSFGRTYIAEGFASKGETDTRVAVKIILKASLITQVAMMDVYREVAILRRLAGHEGIVTFIEAFEDEYNMYIVMELCRGGELMDHILSRGKPYSETKATFLIWQVLTAVAFMHEKDVIHRDIKPENFLFADTKNSVLKAIDFGLSEICPPGGKLSELVGSPFYVAPEVLQQVYDLKADEWSVGVLAYILLIGTRPFLGGATPRSSKRSWETIQTLIQPTSAPRPRTSKVSAQAGREKAIDGCRGPESSVDDSPV